MQAHTLLITELRKLLEPLLTTVYFIISWLDMVHEVPGAAQMSPTTASELSTSGKYCDGARGPEKCC